jgi:hypothetical protein
MTSFPFHVIIVETLVIFYEIAPFDLDLDAHRDPMGRRQACTPPKMYLIVLLHLAFWHL